MSTETGNLEIESASGKLVMINSVDVLTILQETSAKLESIEDTVEQSKSQVNVNGCVLRDIQRVHVCALRYPLRFDCTKPLAAGFGPVDGVLFRGSDFYRTAYLLRHTFL